MNKVKVDNIIMSPYHHYVQHLEYLQKHKNEQAQIDFLLKVGSVMNQYVEEEKKPKLKKCMAGTIWSSFVKTDDTTEMDNLADKYFRLCNLTNTEKEKWNVKPAAKPVPTTYEFTECCEDPDILLLNEYAVCSNCGEKVTGSEQYSANFTDIGNSPNKTINIVPTVVANKNNKQLEESDIEEAVLLSEKKKPPFEYLQRIQGMKSSPITLKSWQIIYDAITAGIEDRKMISHAHVVRELQKLRLAKHYPDSPVIWEHITGNTIPAIPEGALWVIMNKMLPHFNVGTTARDASGKSMEETKKSSMKTFVYKCLELCECKGHLHLIESLKGQESAQHLDMLWERHCKQGGWRYIS